MAQASPKFRLLIKNLLINHEAKLSDVMVVSGHIVFAFYGHKEERVDAYVAIDKLLMKMMERARSK